MGYAPRVDRRWLVAVLGLIGGCAQEVLQLDLPPLPRDTRAAVIAVEEAGVALRVRAAVIEGDAPPDFGFRLGEDGPVEVTLLTYLDPLEDLRLAPGIVPAARDDRAAVPLPTAAETFVATVDSDASLDPAEVWSRTEQTSAAVAEFRTELIAEAPNPCPGLAFSLIDAASIGQLESIVGAPDGTHAIVATSSRGFHALDAEGIAPIPEIPSDTPAQAAHATADGSVWFFGADGVVTRYKPGETVETVATTGASPWERILRIDGAPDLPLEAIVVTASAAAHRCVPIRSGNANPAYSGPASVWRIEGTRWIRLFDFVTDGSDAALWLARGEAIIGDRDVSVRRVSGRTLTRERLPPDGGAITAFSRLGPEEHLAVISELEPAPSSIWRVGTHLKGADGWRALHTIELDGGTITDASPLGGGFVYSAGAGLIGGYLADHGFCAPSVVLPPRPGRSSSGASFGGGKSPRSAPSASRHAPAL